MRDPKIIDLSEILKNRAADDSKSRLDELIQEHFRELFQMLSEHYGLSDTWATEKAAIASNLVIEFVCPIDMKVSIDLPAEIDDAKQTAICMAINSAAKRYGDLVLT